MNGIAIPVAKHVTRQRWTESLPVGLTAHSAGTSFTRLMMRS